MSLGQGVDVAVAGLLANVRRNNLHAVLGNVADDAFPQGDVYPGEGGRMLLLGRRGVGGSAEAQPVLGGVQGEDGYVIIMEGLQNQIGHPAAQLVQIQDVGDLGADRAYQGELLEAPVLDGRLSPGLDGNRRVGGDTVEEIDLGPVERRSLLAFHLQNAQEVLLGDQRNGDG